MEGLAAPVAGALCGFAGGAVMGYAARVGRFCTLQALEDAFFAGDLRRLRAWALAIAVALAVTQTAAAGGLIDLSHSIYHHTTFPWLSAILGGLLFGAGMALVGTCGFGTLARIGGGDLRAIVVFLVIGVSAYTAMAGITGMFRENVLDLAVIDLGPIGGASLNTILDTTFGLDTGPFWGYAIALGLAVWALKDAFFRATWRLVVAGLAVGAAVGFGWVATGWLIADPFDPQRVESFSFVRPLGNTIVYVMTFSGATIDFGIGAVLGVIAGAFGGAIRARDFRWEACDDARELRRHLVGAFFMGTGGVLAMGCTIGQGLSAVATLSITAPVVMISIALGARLGLAWLMEGSLLGLVAALQPRRR
ncbi:YeeE/YedE family protein [Rhodobium gokarnense]|uniref:Membrane protein YedE/YeeE n=1 Tax=Rhodobium gokarnense TaxID=364296 RepID=A0ABT3HHE2_9HYPH|nr:YeeE/YedE family protein [Rhodobium gokarnense]MCW2309817.1 putative membrane protein YedE/YeeE [Rhodobium gokarnense]